MVYLLITSHISMPGTRDHYARVHAPGVRVTVLPVLGAAPLPLALLVAGVGGAQRRRAAAPDPAPLANKNILSPRSKTIFILDANNTHQPTVAVALLCTDHTFLPAGTRRCWPRVLRNTCRPEENSPETARKVPSLLGCAAAAAPEAVMVTAGQRRAEVVTADCTRRSASLLHSPESTNSQPLLGTSLPSDPGCLRNPLSSPRMSLSKGVSQQNLAEKYV